MTPSSRWPRHFAGLDGGGRPAPDEADYRGGDFREERPLEQVHLTFGLPGVAYDDDDFYPAQVLATVLGGGMSSRLFQEVRERRGLAYSVFAFSASYTDGGMFGLYAGTGEAQVPELVPVICEEMRNAAETVTDEETDRARAQLKAGLMMSLESSPARCEQLGRQLQIFGRVLPPAEIVGKIDAVAAPAVRALARRVSVSGGLSLAAVGPISRLEHYDQIAARFA